MNKKLYLILIICLLFTDTIQAQLVTELGLGNSYSNPVMSNKVNTEKHIFQEFSSGRTPKISVGYKINKFYPYFNLLMLNNSMSFDVSEDIDKNLDNNIQLNYLSWYKGIGVLYQFYQRKKISMNAGVDIGTFKSNMYVGWGGRTANSVAFVQTTPLYPIYESNKRQFTYGLKFQFEYKPIKNSIGLDIFYNRSFNTIYKFRSDFQISNYTGSFDTQSKAGQLYIGINYKIYWIKKKTKDKLPEIGVN